MFDLFGQPPMSRDEADTQRYWREQGSKAVHQIWLASELKEIKRRLDALEHLSKDDTE